ncbi:MAG: response regulator [bacterium]|nr:response regulator [bacterium]
MNILVLDDHYEDIKPLLNAWYASDTVSYVTTPFEATRKLGKEKFDVLILDGDLGSYGNGPEVLRAWKGHGLALPPVVMFSASPDMRAEGMEAGAIWAIAKENCSFEDFEELKRRVAVS